MFRRIYFKKKIQKQNWIILSGLFLLTSCDCLYNYEYKIENRSSKSIHISWDLSYGLDSSISIESGKSAILFTIDHGIERCRKGPFFEDVNKKLIEVNVVNTDTLTSKLDYTHNDQWSYNDGKYIAIVKDDEFN